MPTFQVDDQLHSHPKFNRAGYEAMGLWVKAGSWCSCYGTDGYVTGDDAVTLGPKRLWSRLISAGFVDEIPPSSDPRVGPHGGYRLHDFLHWNEPAAYFAKLKARKAANQRDHRAKARTMSHVAAPVTGDTGGDVHGDAAGDMAGQSPGDTPVTSRARSAEARTSACNQRSDSSNQVPVAPGAEPGTAPPKAKGKKPPREADQAIEVMVLWRDAFKRRTSKTYIESRPKDFAQARSLLKQATELVGQAPGPERDAMCVLKFWFDQYLADEEPFLLDNGHKLAFLGGKLAKYGLPWEASADDFEWKDPPPHDEDPPGTEYPPPPEALLKSVEAWKQAQERLR